MALLYLLLCFLTLNQSKTGTCAVWLGLVLGCMQLNVPKTKTLAERHGWLKQSSSSQTHGLFGSLPAVEPSQITFCLLTWKFDRAHLARMLSGHFCPQPSVFIVYLMSL